MRHSHFVLELLGGSHYSNNFGYVRWGNVSKTPSNADDHVP